MERADPHIGLLHRGTEKLIEYKTYLQVCWAVIVISLISDEYNSYSDISPQTIFLLVLIY